MKIMRSGKKGGRKDALVVSKIPTHQIKNAIQGQKEIEFDISIDAFDRQAVGWASFERGDIAGILEAVGAKFEKNERGFRLIRQIIESDWTDKQKITKIQSICHNVDVADDFLLTTLEALVAKKLPAKRSK